MAERTRYRETLKARHVVDTGMYTLIGSSQHGYPAPPARVTEDYGEGKVTENTVDVVTPNFAKLIEQGAVINNPFTRTIVNWTNPHPGDIEHIYRKVNGLTCYLHSPAQTHDKYYRMFGYKYVGGYNNPMWLVMDPALRAAKRQNAIDLAVTQAHANIDTSEMLALASAAESRKTVDSMRNILWRVFKIAKNVRKLNFSALRNELSPKEVAQRYMEARYAIRPLIYDAAGVANAFSKARGYERRTFRGFAEDGYDTSDTVTGVQSFGMVKTNWKRTLEYSVSVRAGVMCDVQISDLTTFGIDKLAESAWELFPFSFIVDWFANVGDTIAAHTPDAGVTQLASWATVRERLFTAQTKVGHTTTSVASGYVDVSVSFPDHTWSREELVLDRVKDPEISVLPSVALHLDGYKLTDLAIILRQILR